MARPAETYRGNNASKVSGRGRFTRLKLAAERKEALTASIAGIQMGSGPGISKSTLVHDDVDVHFDEVAIVNSPVEEPAVESVEETAKDRTNRLARERRAAKKLLEQAA